MTNVRIRPATAADAPHIASLVADEFERFVAPDYGEEGRGNFLAFVAADAIGERLGDPGVAAALAVDGQDGIVGYIEWRGHHVSLLFVRHTHHRMGAARALLEHGTRQRPGVDVTVNASPFSVPAYGRLGFRAIADWAERDGIRFLPMARRG